MKKLLFEGVGTALYTPFTQDGIDYESFEKLIYRQLEAKIDCLVILGTTGESPTVKRHERRQMISFAVEKIRGRVPLIVGTGSNDTSVATEQTLEAKELKADGALIVTPYYNLCEQDGLYEHYKTVSENSKFPFICYNVPKRTGVNISPETFSIIKDLDFCFGIKEASSDEEQIRGIFSASNDEAPVYSGNDSLNLDFLKRGGKGFISVASNVIPLKIKEIFEDFTNNYKSSADEKQEKLQPFFKGLFNEVNPIPVKAMAEILFGEKQNLRLPLTKTNEKNFEKYSQLISEVTKC